MTNPAGFNVPNVRKPDGSWELGGTVNFLSTGVVQVDGSTVTPADALVGVTASSDELNLNDGAVAGTSVASKTLALGADKETDVLALPVSGLKIGAGAGTAVTATAAELNAATGVTLGTVIASKNVTVDASLNTTGINNLNTTGNTVLGNGAGDTFKVHGTGGSGAQSAFTTAPPAITGGQSPTETEHNDALTEIAALKACLINHGLMAAS